MSESSRLLDRCLRVDGSYRRLDSLEQGIDGVGLWELPRFRPDLVAKRLGIPQRALRLLGALDDDPAAA